MIVSDGAMHRAVFLAELVRRLGGYPIEAIGRPLHDGTYVRVNMPDEFAADAVAMCARSIGTKVTLKAAVPDSKEWQVNIAIDNGLRPLPELASTVPQRSIPRGTIPG